MYEGEMAGKLKNSLYLMLLEVHQYYGNMGCAAFKGHKIRKFTTLQGKIPILTIGLALS